jgi:hypothetical protein|tara:strand:+ start:1127 stop:1360 length:234 start_codon:yes stop_codon:yes gene_type:complete
MGFANSEHIKVFVKGKEIRDIYQDKDRSGTIFIEFTNGEKLRLWGNPIIPKLERPQVEIIATPFNLDGDIKQSLDIN